MTNPDIYKKRYDPKSLYCDLEGNREHKEWTEHSNQSKQVQNGRIGTEKVTRVWGILNISDLTFTGSLLNFYEGIVMTSLEKFQAWDTRTCSWLHSMPNAKHIQKVIPVRSGLKK